MKTFVNKAMLTLLVFGFAIISSFAMDNNPPTEPVKKAVVETEVAEEAPQQALMGYGYYNHITKECLLFEGPTPEDCLITNSGPQCTVNIGLNTFLMFLVTRPNTSSPWTCTIPLRKPI